MSPGRHNVCLASRAMTTSYDLAIVGAGIVGLAHALAAARLGARVVVIDRDAQANGASVRHFGFVPVTGQQDGACWQRAMRSRDVWAEIAPLADIAIEHRGLAVVAQRPEAQTVLEAFLNTPMGKNCLWHPAIEAHRLFPDITPPSCQGVLWSPHDLRVDSRRAIPKLAAYLERALGVTFLRQTMVQACEPGRLITSRGPVKAQRVVIAANDDFLTLYPERIAAYGLTKCKLQMLRARTSTTHQLHGAVMSDLSLVRYLGYSELPQAQALKARLQQEQSEHLAHGIHLIVVQSGDGSLVIGDSHHYADTPDPFTSERVDHLILDEFAALFGERPQIIERWSGIYPSAPDRLMLVDRSDADSRIVIVTSGTGASTAFALAEEVIGDLFALPIPNQALPNQALPQ